MKINGIYLMGCWLSVVGCWLLVWIARKRGQHIGSPERMKRTYLPITENQ